MIFFIGKTNPSYKKVLCYTKFRLSIRNNIKKQRVDSVLPRAALRIRFTPLLSNVLQSLFKTGTHFGLIFYYTFEKSSCSMIVAYTEPTIPKRYPVYTFPAILSHPKIAARSSSAVAMGLMSKFFTRVSSTFGVRNAGKDGPRRIPFIPR